MNIVFRVSKERSGLLDSKKNVLCMSSVEPNLPGKLWIKEKDTIYIFWDTLVLMVTFMINVNINTRVSQNIQIVSYFLFTVFLVDLAPLMTDTYKFSYYPVVLTFLYKLILKYHFAFIWHLWQNMSLHMRQCVLKEQYGL